VLFEAFYLVRGEAGRFRRKIPTFPACINTSAASFGRVKLFFTSAPART
jgi:hypothetical protein